MKDIRERKKKQSAIIVRTGEENPSDDEEKKDAEGLTLIRELKDFLTVGTNRSGKATTQDIIDHFQKKLNGKPGLLPKFKSLLKRIADLQRTPSGVGFWVLKEEFRTSQGS